MAEQTQVIIKRLIDIDVYKRQGVNRVPAAKLRDQPACGKCKQALFDAHPVELGSNNFTQHISRNDIPVLVDFWAPWCLSLIHI